MTDQLHYTLQIDGMHCGSCERKISDALNTLNAVDSVSVSSKARTATLTSDSLIDEATLRDTVRGAGDYRVIHVEQGHVEQGHPTPAPGESSNADGSQIEIEEPANESLYPLFLIVGFIAGITMLIAWSTQQWELQPMMRHFMAGFFMVFSFFKLLDPPGFVSAYRGYDLVARKSATWAWIYPFVELGLGVMYLMAWAPVTTNTITLILMLIGAAGVLRALLNKQAIRCACLGTALNLPMTKVTLIEDLTMALMAGAMLILIL